MPLSKYGAKKLARSKAEYEVTYYSVVCVSPNSPTGYKVVLTKDTDPQADNVIATYDPEGNPTPHN